MGRFPFKARVFFFFFLSFFWLPQTYLRICVIRAVLIQLAANGKKRGVDLGRM